MTFNRFNTDTVNLQCHSRGICSKGMVRHRCHNMDLTKEEVKLDLHDLIMISYIYIHDVNIEENNK